MEMKIVLNFIRKIQLLTLNEIVPRYFWIVYFLLAKLFAVVLKVKEKISKNGKLFGSKLIETK